MRRIAPFAVVGLMLAVLPAGLAQPPGYELSPEQFASLPAPTILQGAKDFALQHREAPAAARAGLDWYLAATAVGHHDEQKAARMYLLLEHPRTTSGAFIYQSLKADDQLAELLLEEFNREDRQLDTPFLTRYVLATLMAPQRCMAAAQDNANFMLSLIYALQATGHDAEHPHVKSAQAQLRKRDENGKTSRILDVILAKDRRTAEKFAQLQEFKDNVTARAVQRGLFLRLQILERVRPAEMRLHLENLLTGRKWKEALPWFDKLPADAHDAQVRFWQGWALAASGETAQALEVLAALAKDEPDDAWGKLAAESIPNIQGERARLEALAAMIYAGIKRWKENPPEVFEGRIVLLDEEDESILAEGYLGIDATRSHFEVCIQRDNKLIAAYRTRAGRGAIFSEGKTEIVTFDRGGIIPTPRVSIEEDGDEKYRFNFALGVKDRLQGDLNALCDSLLQSPVLASEQSILRFLTHQHDYGMFLAPVEQGKQQLVWVGCPLDEAKLNRLVFQLGDEGRVTSLLSDSGRIERIRFGLASDLTLTPPAWPDLPKRHQEELQATELFSLAGATWQTMWEISRTSQHEKSAKPQSR
jgi:hypothetical protein